VDLWAKDAVLTELQALARGCPGKLVGAAVGLAGLDGCRL
jgi:hypothetical protein